MRRYELDGRRIKISPALEPDKRFDRKRLGYIKYVINQKKGIELHWIQLNLQRKSITINEPTVARINASGLLKYNKYEDLEDEVPESHGKMVDTKLVATTVSSREIGIERRIETVTTSSHEENQQKTARSGQNSVSFKSKDSKKVFLTGSAKDTKGKNTHKETAYDENNKKRKKKEAAAVQDKKTDISKGEVESSSSSNDSPSFLEETRKDTTTFVVLQKNSRSMNSSERLDELLRELHRVRWDVILISETWRQNKATSWSNQECLPTSMESRYC